MKKIIISLNRLQLSGNISDIKYIYKIFLDTGDLRREEKQTYSKSEKVHHRQCHICQI